MKKIAILLAAALALPSTAHAAAFFNGSFELADFNPGSFTTLNTGSTSISGWTVGGASIDYIGTYWQPGQGVRSVDLSGNAPGSVSQTFDTILNQVYRVDFLIAGNPDGIPPVKTLRVSATGNVSADYLFDKTGHTLAAMGWTAASYAFKATGTSTTLTFANASINTAYGPAIDAVSVAAIPEPASWALMIGGFALAGGAMRRRAVRATYKMA